MIGAYAFRAATLCVILEEQVCELDKEKDRVLGDPWRVRLREEIPEWKLLAEELTLAGVPNKIARILELLEWRLLSTNRLREELIGLRDSIQDQLTERKFFYIKPGRVRFYDLPSDGWGDAPNRFPQAVPDIEEAGKCLALERGTACVFHLMRVAELGLRKLADMLLVTSVGKHFSIEFAQWGQILEALTQKLTTLRDAPKEQRDPQLSDYTELQLSFQGIKDAWRNHVAHARVSYTPEKAYEILADVQGLMRRLAGVMP